MSMVRVQSNLEVLMATYCAPKMTLSLPNYYHHARQPLN